MRTLLATALAVVSLQAQVPVLVSGQSTLKGTRVQTATLSHVIPKAVGLSDLQGGEALLVLVDGSEVRVPCGIQSAPGEAPGTTLAIWRFSIPDMPPLKSLAILQAGKELARFAGRKVQPPDFSLVASGDTEHLSIGWSTKRPLDPGTESMLIRWSRDGGATWDNDGLFQTQADSLGMMELDHLAKVPDGKLVLEFWVVQGLTLHRKRLPVTRS